MFGGKLKMNLGILGAGRMAAVMAETIKKMNAAKDNTVVLCAIASRDISRAHAFATENNIPLAYGSYSEMLQNPDIDCVYIATPHSHHYQHLQLCIDYGKHVLCEKAFTVNALQAQDILRSACEKEVLVTEAIWTRYQPIRGFIQDELASGSIGDAKMITANLCYPVLHKERIVKKELAGGALLDVGIYPLNFAEMLFGHASKIYGSCIKNENGVDMTDSITMEWEDGKVAVLNASVQVVSDRNGVVYGTDGYLVVENINNPQGFCVYDRNYRLIKKISAPVQITGYEYELRETADCIAAGKLECPSMPHEETIRIMTLMDHLRAQMGIFYPCEKLMF